jgi:hypothetical protein
MKKVFFGGRTLDEDIEMVFTYLEFRNSFQMGYVPYTCFKKRIKYILDIDDYLHIRKIFGHLLTKGFIIKSKNRNTTRYLWNPFSIDEKLLVSTKKQTFN